MHPLAVFWSTIMRRPSPHGSLRDVRSDRQGPRWKGFNSVFTAMQRSLSATVAHTLGNHDACLPVRESSSPPNHRLLLSSWIQLEATFTLWGHRYGYSTASITPGSTGIAGLRQINVVGTMADVPNPFEPLKVSLALRKKVITSHLVAERKYCTTELSIRD